MISLQTAFFFFHFFVNLQNVAEFFALPITIFWGLSAFQLDKKGR